MSITLNALQYFAANYHVFNCQKTWFGTQKIILVEVTGIEPATYGLQSHRSTN